MNIIFTRFVFVISLFICSINACFGQNQNILTLSPQGVLEQNFDRFGNKYSLWQLNINEAIASNTISTAKFTLFFENGSGMESPNDPLHNARRRVLLTIINDVENFITSPETTQKINLWIRNIKNVSNFSGSNLSSGSSFYNAAKSTTGGIIDGEVFKTLLAGTNSYKNVVNVPNKFYHGFLAINFQSLNGNPITWHTDLGVPPTSASYDLYSAILKEITHLLGFCSLINANGTSVFGIEYEYFSRYDRFLRNEYKTESLLTSENSNGIYDYLFNTNLSNQILRPNCFLIDNISYENSDNSDCQTALWYVSPSFKTPIYTPVCFEPGYSFSCLEDQFYPDCDSALGNNLYFTTSNNLNIDSYKRYPTPEERLILTDIGYSVSTTFGASATFDGFQTYSNNVDATPLQVIGINDGINQDLTLSFVGDVADGVQISGASLLENDFQANSFVGLQCLTSGGEVSIEAGNSGSNIVFNSTTGGLFLLRYIPSNGFQNGNITYFYVYMNVNNNCGTPIPCDSVINGNFESYVSIPNLPHQIEYACNWKNVAGGISGTYPANYNHMNSPVAEIGVPSNAIGFQNDNIASNKAYASFFCYYWPNFPNFPAGVQTSNTISPIIRTKLTSPMIAGKKYRISYQASKADYTESNISIALQAFVTASNFQEGLLSFLSDTQVAQGSLYTNSNANGTPSFITSTTAWTTVSFDHIAVGGEEYLYIGALNNAPVLNPPAIGGNNFFAMYYYDNVSVKLVETVNDTFAFWTAPTPLVSTNSILDNDNFSGALANITITQTPNPHPFLTINPSGTVTLAANTPLGTYTVNYTITSSCGTSNVATVTVVVQNSVVTANGKCMGPTICLNNNVQTTDSPLSPNSTWHEGLYPAYLINGVPAVQSQLQWFPIGTITPSCMTLNTNGTITVQPNCAINNQYGTQYDFFMKACDVNNPNSCSEPIQVHGYIGPPILAPSYNVYLTQTGFWLQVYNGQYSGNLNVNAHARLICSSTGNNQVVLTQNGTIPYWQLNTATGEIENQGSIYILGQSTISYTICEIGNPSNCATGAVTIHIVN